MVANFTPQDLLIAALQPETGITPAQLNSVILATVILYTIFTTVFTTARLVAKRAISPWALDDYVLFAAWAVGMGYVYLVYALKQAGIGQHMWFIALADGPRLFQLTWVVEMLYCVAIWIAKMALLLQLIRVFAPVKKDGVYWLIVGLIVFHSLFYASTFLAVILRCVPQEKIWNPAIPGTCIGDEVLLIASGAVNMVADFLIFLLPLWATWHLRMKLKYKVGVCAVFATALFALISSIGRFVYTLPLFHSPDLSYIAAQTSLWTIAEIGSILCCTCFPMMPRFFQLAREKTVKYRSKISRIGRTKNNVPYRGDLSAREAYMVSEPRKGATPWAEISGTRQARSRYIPLEDEESGFGKDHGKETGIRRPIELKLTGREHPI